MEQAKIEQLAFLYLCSVSDLPHGMCRLILESDGIYLGRKQL